MFSLCPEEEQYYHERHQRTQNRLLCAASFTQTVKVSVIVQHQTPGWLFMRLDLKRKSPQILPTKVFFVIQQSLEIQNECLNIQSILRIQYSPSKHPARRENWDIKTIRNSTPRRWIFNLDDLLFLTSWQRFGSAEPPCRALGFLSLFLKNPRTARLSSMNIHRKRARNCRSLCCFLFCHCASNCALRKFCRLQTCFALIYFTAPLRSGLMSVLIPGFN